MNNNKLYQLEIAQHQLKKELKTMRKKIPTSGLCLTINEKCTPKIIVAAS